MKSGRFSLIGILLITWGLDKQVFLRNSNSVVIYPTMIIGLLSAFFSIRADVTKLIRFSKPKASLRNVQKAKYNQSQICQLISSLSYLRCHIFRLQYLFLFPCSQFPPPGFQEMRLWGFNFQHYCRSDIEQLFHSMIEKRQFFSSFISNRPFPYQHYWSFVQKQYEIEQLYIIQFFL